MPKYPPADSKTQAFESVFPGALMAPNVLLLHTTEGFSWPSYEGGATAPNYTAQPRIAQRRLEWRQHFPDNRSSRSLVNLPGGVETNTLNVLQVELVGTCDPAHRSTWAGKRAGVDYIFWPDAPDWLLDELAAFVAYCHKAHGIPLEAPRFEAYPASAGTNNGVRMSFTAWRKFEGICGHQHAPENVHGDPGDLDVEKLIAFTKARLAPATTSLLAMLYNLATVHERVAAGMPKRKTQRQVDAEIDAQLEVAGVLALNEGIDWQIRPRSGFDLIRDTTTAGRANIALFVHRELGLDRFGWIPSRLEWHAVKGNGTRMHPARETLRARIHEGDGMQLVVFHMPQAQSRFHDVAAPRAELAGILERLLTGTNPDRRRLALGDENPAHDVTPATLAAAVDGQALNAGHALNGIAKNVTVKRVSYPTQVGGVQMLSDHGRTMRAALEL